jgi:hypothetical protein
MIYDMIWYDMIWYDMVWYDMICIDIWYDMTWYDDMIWYVVDNAVTRLIKLAGTRRVKWSKFRGRWSIMCHCKKLSWQGELAPRICVSHFTVIFLQPLNWSHSTIFRLPFPLPGLLFKWNKTLSIILSSFSPETNQGNYSIYKTFKRGIYKYLKLSTLQKTLSFPLKSQQLDAPQACSDDHNERKNTLR